MNDKNKRFSCEQAVVYFHELALSDNPDIPQEIFKHIDQCPQCQRHFEEFRQIFVPAEQFDFQDETVSLMTDLLSLHFSCSGKEIKCQFVKQFLPTMAIPQLEIRIPTPITAHIDKCGLCTADLETFRKLNLTRRQLYRLSEFLADKKHCCSSADEKRKKAAQIVAALDWEIVDATALKHLCKCPSCSDVLYQHRQRILENLSVCSRKIPCQAIFAGGFFDYVLPYGIDPAKDEYAKLREPFVSHIMKCPDCLAKMQQLHRSIYAIEQRPDSGVITVFHEDASRKNKFVPGADNIYHGFPIKVDTFKEKSPGTAVINLQKVKQAKSRFGLKLTAGVAAAIFVIVGFSLFFHNTVTADLTPVQKMEQALQNVNNVHTSQYRADTGDLGSEQWRSKTFNAVRIKDKNKDVLYDVDHQNMKTKFANGKIEKSSLGREDWLELKNY